MKINPISTNLVQKTKTVGKVVNNKVENPIVQNNLVLPNDYTKLAFASSNLSFTGNRQVRNMKANFTAEAQDLYATTQNFAKSIGAKEIETWHFYYNSLLAVKNYIQELDEGRANYDQETRLKLPFELEAMVAENCTALSNEKSRAKIAEVIDKHIEIMQKDFIQEEINKPQSKIKAPVLSKPTFSEECADDLTETYELMASQMDSDTYYDSFFFSTAYNAKDKKLTKEAWNLVFDLQNALMVDDVDKKKKNHLRFYDEKADVIWKNLSLRNDAICLYPSDDTASSQYLTSSFINLVNKPNQSYKGIDPKNTNIVLLNKYATFDYLNNAVKKAKHDPENNGKTTVFIADIMDLFKPSNGQLTEADVNTLINEANSKEGDNRNVRLVLTMTPEVYYANTQKGAGLANIFSKYAVQTLPSLNASDAIAFLTDENGMKFVQNEAKGEFSKEVITKAVELTAQDGGNYPDKAINLLSGAKKYYIDKDEITTKDLETFVAETKKLSETSGVGDDIKVVYDTGKRLSDIVGSPMTRADAEAIVNQIKTRTIGTKGISAYLDNGTSYGGGRRHTAEAIAGEAGIPMITINAQDFAIKDIDMLSQNADLSEMKIRKIVSLAKAQAEANPNKTAMIFIENFDNFAANPMYGVSSIYEQKAFSQLLSEMENARKNDDVNLVVVGSVNMPEVIDMNIMKPYKFLDSIIVFPPQDTNERQDVLNYYVNKLNIEVEGETDEEKQKVINDLAETTRGFTVVDLIYLLETSKSVVAERGKDKIGSADFVEAYLRTTSGRPNLAYIPEARKKIVTSHEAGHALTLQLMYEIAEKQGIAWHLPNKVNFITLDPRANYGGAMYPKGSENEELSFEAMIAEMICTYGGHASENVLYNMSGSWGITGDMEQAESLARIAVLDMGMGPKTGVRHVRRNALGAPDVSNEKMRDIEADCDAFHKGAKNIADEMISVYKGFVEEFTEKHFSKVGTGECLVSSEEFINELNAWREAQPKEKQEEIKALEKEVLSDIEKLKTGEYIKR